MSELSKIIEKLKTAPDDELCELELDLFGMIYDKKGTDGIVVCFLTLSSWVGFSLRDGVWTFYEYTDDESIEKLKGFLELKNWNELTDMYKRGMHDYHDVKYMENYDYPDEWIEESEIIDSWIFENEAVYIDLKRYVVVMGRRSYEEIGKPLQNRTTIVVSSTKLFEGENCYTVSSLQEAIKLAGARDIYISGGARLYTEAVKLVDKMYITEIGADIEGDTYFPDFEEELFDKEIVERFEGEIPYTYVTYIRRR